MGYVFEPELYRKGLIPTLEDYDTAARTVRRGLERALAPSSGGWGIVGAIPNGSFFNGQGSVGSDLDVVVMVTDPSALTLLRELQTELAPLQVPVDFVPLVKAWAERGMHTIDTPYAHYMRDFCLPDLIGANPLPFIRVPAQSTPTDYWEMTTYKANKLLKRSLGARGFNREHCEHLEHVLRWPIITALDVLRSREGSFPAEQGRPITKARIVQRFAALPDAVDTRTLYAVLDLREQYRQMLRSRANPQRYQEMLEAIDAVAISSAAFIANVAATMYPERT